MILTVVLNIPLDEVNDLCVTDIKSLVVEGLAPEHD